MQKAEQQIDNFIAEMQRKQDNGIPFTQVEKDAIINFDKLMSADVAIMGQKKKQIDRYIKFINVAVGAVAMVAIIALLLIMIVVLK